MRVLRGAPERGALSPRSQCVGLFAFTWRRFRRWTIVAEYVSFFAFMEKMALA